MTKLFSSDTFNIIILHVILYVSEDNNFSNEGLTKLKF